MHISVIGINHRTAPVDVRERLSLIGELAGALLRAIRAELIYEEAVVLDTCNRTEIYVVSSRGDDQLTHLLAHVAEYHPGDGEKQIALIHELLDEGLDGFELYHPSNAAEPHFDRLVREAERTGCAISGGSDCHNAIEGGAKGIGCSQVPDRVVETIESALAKRGSAQGG